MNNVVLMGRLARDPETKYTQGDKPIAICKFTLCIKKGKDKDGKDTTDFISCKAIGARAEVIDKFVRKGERLLISGSWETGSFKKQDGTTVYTNECLVNTVEFIEPKSNNTEPNPNISLDDFDETDLPF